MSWAGAALALAAVFTSVPATTVFSFADPSITESSALIDFGSFMVTTNDSGGGPLVYVVDAKTGRTVATTTYADEVTDTEALAPAGKDAVWVGDIGDNLVQRSHVTVYRAPVDRFDQRVHATPYELVYPDGPHDAESLLFGPDGRLRIITKSLLGGRVYVAPKTLDASRPNKLRAGPLVDLYATDAALFPDGKHVLVRGYGGALLATFPGFKTLAQFPLPGQEQGEGISIGSNGRIRLSSEGEHSTVLQIALPAEARRALKGEAAPSKSAAGSGRSDATADDDGVDWRWMAAGAGATALLGFGALRRRR